MRKSILITICILGANLAMSKLSPAYTISGNCTVQEKGTLYIYLVDSETFKKKMTGIQILSYDVEAVDNRPANIGFSFEDVEPGVYGIRSFLDTDNTKKLNVGLFGPTEPWGMSFKKGRRKGIPSFSDISFDVQDNISDLTIEIK